MIELTLQIEKQQDLSILLPLLDRLGIEVLPIKSNLLNIDNKDRAENALKEIIQQGIEIPHLESFMEEFEMQRQDRAYPH